MCRAKIRLVERGEQVVRRRVVADLRLRVREGGRSAGRRAFLDDVHPALDEPLADEVALGRLGHAFRVFVELRERIQ